jgi:colanic acid/amylovoran biosynthesis protein
MRVVITNTQLYNGGDAAIAIAIISILANSFGKPLDIIVLDPFADGAAKYYPDLCVRQMPFYTFANCPRGVRGALTRLGPWFHRLRARYFTFLLTRAERQALDIYRRADLVISTGGTYLVEHYDLRARLYELYLAIFAGRPPVFFTQSLGPFSSPKNRRALKEIFDAAPLVMLRDERSRRNVLDLGIDAAKTQVLADAVFALADPSVLTAAASRKAEVRRVAISVRWWQNFQGRTAAEGMRIYRLAVARAVEFLVRERRAEVVFISTCQGIDEYGARDSAVADEVVASLAPDVAAFVRVDSDFHRPAQLMDMLKGFDLVIATRMHMAILALVSGIPVLPVAYEFKTEELFESGLGMAEWLLSIDTLSEASISNLLPRFLSELPNFRARLFGAVMSERESALRAGDMLKALMGAGAPIKSDMP